MNTSILLTPASPWIPSPSSTSLSSKRNMTSRPVELANHKLFRELDNEL